MHYSLEEREAEGTEVIAFDACFLGACPLMLHVLLAMWLLSRWMGR